MRYISELEHKVQTLQTEATTLSAQLTLLQVSFLGACLFSPVSSFMLLSNIFSLSFVSRGTPQGLPARTMN